MNRSGAFEAYCDAVQEAVKVFVETADLADTQDGDPTYRAYCQDLAEARAIYEKAIKAADSAATT